MRALALDIADPALKLRALATPDAMQAHLPEGWIVEAPSFAMVGPADQGRSVNLAEDYRLEVQRDVTAVHAFVLTKEGELAASGHGGEGPRAFVCDRIVTQPEHQRRGLASVVMAVLEEDRRDRSKPQLLVATVAGRALYESLGWRVVAPYASAHWVGDSPVKN